MRHAVLQSRVRGGVDIGTPLLSAAVQKDEVVAVTEGGDVVRTKPASNEVVATHPDGVNARSASFANDGTALVTGRDGQVRMVTPAGDVVEITGVSAAAGAAISPDASRAMVIEQGRARLVDLASGRTLHVYEHPGVRSAAISPDNRRVLTGGADDTVRVWSGRADGASTRSPSTQATRWRSPTVLTASSSRARAATAPVVSGGRETGA